MPKTAVHKDDQLPGWKDDVGLTRQVTSVKSISQACSMKRPSHSKLGLCIPATNQSHLGASSGLTLSRPFHLPRPDLHR
jgi:hypothetical protein